MSGKLVGINAEQQKRLNGLAEELDRLKKLKQANEDAAKAQAFRATLNESNVTARAGFAIELAGSGSGDKLRERLRADLEIQQDYNKQLADLQKQFNSSEISKELYDQETDMLRQALAERLEIQHEYYAAQDEAQSNWLDGVTSAWENFADAAANYSAMAADTTTSILGGARSELGNFMSDVATGASDAGDALMDMVTGFAKSTVQALADMAAQWLVYQAVQLVVGKTAQSTAAIGLVANAQATAFQAQLAAFASTAAIPVVGPGLAPGAAAAAAAATAPMVAGVSSAAFAGIAHGGIDNIPKESTWLLDAGERVLSPNQNRDLTAFLSRAGGASGGGSSPSININTNVTVQAQPGASDEDARRVGDMVGASLDDRIVEVLRRETQQGGVLWRR